MSRSYKKIPFCGQTQHHIDKRIANHKIRQKLKNHLDWNIQYNDYKKLSESWNIRDWGWVNLWEDWYNYQLTLYYKAVVKWGEKKARRYGYTDDFDELYTYWHKHYKRK